jgi:hypothetical protein
MREVDGLQPPIWSRHWELSPRAGATRRFSTGSNLSVSGAEGVRVVDEPAEPGAIPTCAGPTPASKTSRCRTWSSPRLHNAELVLR